jgi:putative flippase GtrA
VRADDNDPSDAPESPGPKIPAPEPVRYLVVSLVCAGLNNLVLIGADHVGMGYPGVLASSWLISGSVGYGLHTRFSFIRPPELRGYARFMLGVALGIPLAFAALWIFRSGLRWPMWTSAPAATVAMLVFNYVSARIAILRRAPWSRTFQP